MFKKKIKIKQSKQSEVLQSRVKIEDLPTNVVQFAYEELMKVYNEEIDNEIKSELQMKLVVLSKILTDRSLKYGDDGNSKVKLFFIKRRDITEETWDKLTIEEKNHASNIMQSIVKMEKEVAQFSKEDNIEDDLTPSFIQKENNDKEKKSFGSFFKKKKLVADKPINEIRKEPDSSVISLLKHGIKKEIIKEITKEERIKARAKVIEDATISRYRNKNEEKDTEEKINLKTFENVYCHQCKHSLKAHQSKGVSGGCRCGCLETIEDIAKEHGLFLRNPVEVLQIIAEENEQTPPPLEIAEPLDDEPINKVIEKQAKAVESMFKNAKPKPEQEQIESSTQKILEQMEVEQDSRSISPPKIEQQRPHKVVGDVCSNCDHLPNLHFDNPENSFCTVIGCTCETFRSYPT